MKSNDIPFLRDLGGYLREGARGPGPKSRTPGFIAGGAGAAIVAVLVLVLWPTSQRDGSRGPAVGSEVDVVSVDRSALQPVGSQLTALTVSEGPALPSTEGPHDILATEAGAWLTTNMRLVFIDGATGKPVSQLPLETEVAARLAVTRSGVWVFDGVQHVQRLSSDGDLEEVVNVAAEDMVGIGPSLWVSAADDSVRRLSGPSGAEILHVDGGLSGDISAAEGGVWVSGHLIEGDSVFVSNEGLVTTKILEASNAIEAAGHVWVISYEAPFDRDEASAVAAIDVETGKTVMTLNVPRAAALATDGEDVWVYALAPSTTKNTWTPDPRNSGRILLIDGEKLEPVGSATWGLGPVQMSAGDGALWIADLSTDKVARVTST